MMDGDVDPVKVANEMGLTKGFYHDPPPDHAIMLVADKLMNGSGSEGLTGEYVDRYYQNIQASYVNLGDTYSTTLLFDHVNQRFVITSWGDFVESHPRRFPSENPPRGADKMWTYRGVDVYPADRNSSGIRWYARMGIGYTLRADTMQGMRQLINKHVVKHGENPPRGINNQDREQWIDNDEGLYGWWKSSRLSKRDFIKQNKAEIDAAIRNVTEGKKPAHYLAYGPLGTNPQYNLYPPWQISARLLPAVKIGDSWISIEHAGQTSDGRLRYKYYIDTPAFEHSGHDIKSGVGGGSLEQGMESLLAFLGAAAGGRESGNSDLFPKKVNEWAYQHSDEIEMMREEVESGMKSGFARNPGGDGDEEDDFDLKGEMRDGAVIGDARGGGYDVAFGGKHFAHFVEMNDALAAVVVKMDEDQFWPNVFIVNDHGNVDLVVLKPRVTGKTKAGKIMTVAYTIIRSWV